MQYWALSSHLFSSTAQKMSDSVDFLYHSLQFFRYLMYTCIRCQPLEALETCYHVHTTHFLR